MRARSDAVPFLPAAPPGWAARSLAWVLLAIFAVVAVAVVLVQVPETVSAPFVLVAVKGSHPVRALHAGIITSVRVIDAQTIAAGAPLFTIGSETIGDRTAERDALGTSLAGGRTRLGNERQKFEHQRQADEQDAARLAARVTALEAQAAIKGRQAELAREIAARTQRSYERGLTSWMDTTASRLEVDRLTAELEQVRADLASTRSDIGRLRFEMASRQSAFDETARRVDEELSLARTRKGMLDREGPRDGNALTVVASCSGTVTRLLARSAGAVVAEGALLAELVCDDDRVQVELSVPQRGFALVTSGQPVKLRYDAFPYERYGVKYATLRWTSPASTGAEDGSFRALAELDEAAVHAGGQVRRLLPGMRGQASIVVGRRSLASFVLEPLRRLRENVSTGPGGSSP